MVGGVIRKYYTQINLINIKPRGDIINKLNELAD